MKSTGLSFLASTSFCYPFRPGGKRGLLEGQAKGAARLPRGDERAHLPPRRQVPRLEEGLDAGERCFDCVYFLLVCFGRVSLPLAGLSVVYSAVFMST